MSLSRESERRMTMRLMAWWQEQRDAGDTVLPHASALAHRDAQDLAPWLFRLPLAQPDIRQSRFDFFGISLTALFHQDYTGRTLREALTTPLLGEMLIPCGTVAETGIPYLHAGEAPTPNGQAQFRCLIVPFASDGKTIDCLAGTTNYRLVLPS